MPRTSTHFERSPPRVVRRLPSDRATRPKVGSRPVDSSTRVAKPNAIPQASRARPWQAVICIDWPRTHTEWRHFEHV